MVRFRSGQVQRYNILSEIAQKKRRFRVRPVVLLRTDAEAWIERQTTRFTAETPTLDPATGERAGSYPTAVALTRMRNGRQQRILVTGDADCFSNAELTATTRPGIVSYNFTILPATFRWLCYGQFPVSPARPALRDRDITLSPMNLDCVVAAYLYALPLLIGLLGLFICRRRRKG